MSTRQFFPVLLTALLVSAGIALLFSSGAQAQTNSTGDTTTTSTAPSAGRGARNDSAAAKLDRPDHPQQSHRPDKAELPVGRR
jgi:hypothetical protein